ncbi:carbonic anhydrase [Nocardiopsis metallicus]|uniref:carbonic anhydrase n=1 Tax=Nocardiopsis metallicus TaxID=179819 RepID=A0A840WC92_9ACTN|nr:carbonic anhydrase [Nocardiopsis metallicus]MBB5493013.1 carbonic anhydrase [Nocardiopsis metallicus]
MAITRRGAFKASLLGGVGAAVATTLPSSAWAGAAPAGAVTGDAKEALRLLKEGNRRWHRHVSQHPHESRARRAQLVEGQEPFAVVLGCADSRVPPELVFDRGLGDLFTIRSAGQVLDGSVLGSLTYAVEHLRTPLIVVMGHQSCGAVDAAVQAHRTGELPHGHVGGLVAEILEVVESTPDDGEDFLDDCVRANARHIARRLREDGELGEFVADGRLKVVAARYDLESSRVTWL